jgi:hypothetical protein
VLTGVAVAAVALLIPLAGVSSAATESGVNKITTVGQVRSYLSSVAIGRDGLPVISYYGKGHLKVVHCGNPACSHGNTFSRVDKQPGVGYSSSITIGADGLALISYGSNPFPAGGSRENQHLKVVRCGNRACSRGNTITVVDKHPAVGYDSSIRIGADKRPVISYQDLAGDLELLRCGNRACTAANTSTMVAASDSRAVFAIGRDGLPLIAYGNANEWLAVLHCGNRSCTSGNSTATFSGLLGPYALTIGRDGLPLIATSETPGVTGIGVMHCGNRACTSGNSTANVDDAPHGFGDVEIAIGRDGRPVLSYIWGFELKVLHCGNRTCSTGNTSYLVDRRSPITAGTNPSLTIGADGFPLVSYVVAPPSPRSHQYKLKVLHCGNGSCRPHR